MADLHKAQGRYVAAESLYQRSLAIREKALGPDHPDVAASLENMSKLYAAMDKPDDAKKLADRAAEIRALKR